ncbi:MAG: DUF4037 domain-containing protein [Dehalococcoidales bacterium]|nr:MAG: DUF4037 domain-containing protein [Dehalococcoidales bacterium]
MKPMIESLPPFIKGMELCKRFYQEAVRPLMDQYFPSVKYSAAKLDTGSEILGLDTPQSRDHHWGPKVMIFVDEQYYDLLSAKISKLMAEELPFTFQGYPTNFAIGDTASGGVMEFTDQRPLNHGVSVHTVGSFFEPHLGIIPEDSISEKQWLTMSQQRLSIVVKGLIFHDGLGRLSRIQEKLRWYPEDVWIYLLACQWVRLDQEEPFTTRCGDVGDELGSRIVATRQVVELMRLCFLMEKQYWPYYKWFGSVFSQLACAPLFSPILTAILDASTWRERESYLNQAYVHAGEMHNRLGITDPIDTTISQFFDRPYNVIHVERFWLALLDKVDSKLLKSMWRLVGSVDQFADSTDIFSWTKALSCLGSVYDLGR